MRRIDAGKTFLEKGYSPRPFPKTFKLRCFHIINGFHAMVESHDRRTLSSSFGFGGVYIPNFLDILENNF